MSASDAYREAKRRNAHIASAMVDAVRGFVAKHGAHVPAPDIMYAHPDTPPDVVDALRKENAR